MKNSNISFLPGDKCFLLSKLPFDVSFIDQLPFEISPGIHFIQTPKYALESSTLFSAPKEEHMAWSGWIYPAYGLPGIEVWDVCLKIDKDAKIDEKAKNLCFWMAITALYLVKPLFISVAGSFIYGDKKIGFLETAERIDLRSNICLEGRSEYFSGQNALSYNKTDLDQAKLIFPVLVKTILSQKTTPRDFFNLRTFLQATFWDKLNYEGSIFGKLFPFLDSFTGNPHKNHSTKVSERVSKFLAQTPISFSKDSLTEDCIKSRLSFIWEVHRYPELHGHYKEPFTISTANSSITQIHSDFGKDLFDLFEISRLCLLKMLLLENADLQTYSQIPIPSTGLDPKTAAPLNSNRGIMTESFFKKSYPTPKCLTSYSDLL